MDEVLTKARANWKKSFPAHKNAVATIGWISNSGANKYYWDGPCHAYLSNAMITGNELVSVFSGIHPHRAKNEEAERTFIEWLLFHSPFKDSFLKDTTAEALDHRVLMGNPDQPANYMSAGLMSTRIFNEHPRSLSMWWEFVSRGLHPNIAFAFAHKMYVDDNGRVVEYVPTHTGCFNGQFQGGYYDQKGARGEAYLLNFLRGITTNLEQPYRSSSAGATSTFKLWGKPTKDGEKLKLLEAVPDLLKRAAGGKVEIKNPFAKSKPNYSARPLPKLEDAMELLIPHLSKYKELF